MKNKPLIRKFFKALITDKLIENTQFEFLSRILFDDIV